MGICSYLLDIVGPMPNNINIQHIPLYIFVFCFEVKCCATERKSWRISHHTVNAMKWGVLVIELKLTNVPYILLWMITNFPITLDLILSFSAIFCSDFVFVMFVFHIAGQFTGQSHVCSWIITKYRILWINIPNTKAFIQNCVYTHLFSYYKYLCYSKYQNKQVMMADNLCMWPSAA